MRNEQRELEGGIMGDVLIFTASSENRVDDVASQLEQMGFKLAEQAVATTASGVDSVIHSTSEILHQSRLGLLIGAAIGWHVGLALLIFIGSPALYQWGGAVLIPVGGALGWAALGGIVGGSGVFSYTRVSPRLESYFEQEVAQGKILISVRLRSTEEIQASAKALHQAGASEVYYRGKRAA
jgi:hypothetical protein